MGDEETVGGVGIMAPPHLDIYGVHATTYLDLLRMVADGTGC
jgi:hypothetical protein